MKLKSFFIVFMLLIGSVATSWADFIIPININKTLKHIIKVAKADGDFTDINSALTSITDASINNKYLIYIGPGTYYGAPIIMKEYVDITGSGEGVTTISGSLTADNYYGNHAVVVGESNTRLSNLTIQNAGLSGNYSTALYLYAKTMYVENVTLKVIGTSDKNFGLFIMTDASSVIKNVTALAIGAGVHNVAIDVQHAGDGVVFENITAKASNASTSNYAIENYRSKLIIRRSVLDATNYGLYSSDNTANTYISQSSIVKSVTGDNIKCAACDDGVGNDVNISCNNDVNGI